LSSGVNVFENISVENMTILTQNAAMNAKKLSIVSWFSKNLPYFSQKGGENCRKY
jgi:hypothetical protein